MNADDLFQFEETGQERNPHLVPWLVTAIVSVIALLIAFLVVSGAKSASTDVEETDDPEVEETTTPETPDPSDEEEEEPQPTEEPADPSRPDDSIDVSNNVIGSTFDLEIAAWNVEAPTSGKIPDVSYDIPEGNKLLLKSELISSLPASCDKKNWGLEKLPSGDIVYLSPQKMCAENESLYIELLAIVKHMASGVKPL